MPQVVLPGCHGNRVTAAVGNGDGGHRRPGHAGGAGTRRAVAAGRIDTAENMPAARDCRQKFKDTGFTGQPASQPFCYVAWGRVRRQAFSFIRRKEMLQPQPPCSVATAWSRSARSISAIQVRPFPVGMTGVDGKARQSSFLVGKKDDTEVSLMWSEGQLLVISGR